ncbi:MAG: hypothetical protein UU09_C0009G0007 [Microgenomates group bacterium GW2011_GWA2_40_6]|nr:MAG: hypothetical protein UU09_C0009G0007 [Microgenomates group bacterium GW2011_GWA2_40_6]
MPNSTSSTLNSIESLIHSHQTRLESLSKELKTHKLMLESIMEANKEYQEIADAAAKAVKLKSQAKQKVLTNPEAKSQMEKIKDELIEVKELKIALSDYLSQYVTLSGSNQIESPDGFVYDIIYNAHLTKKKQD